MLPQSNSFSRSSTWCQFSVTSSLSFSLRQFVGSFCKVVNRTCQTSPLLDLNNFKAKSKLIWKFQSKERHKTVNRSWHHWNNHFWLQNHAVLYEINVWAYVAYFFVVTTCNDLFDFSLTFSLWKILLYMLFMWGFIFQAH